MTAISMITSGLAKATGGLGVAAIVYDAHKLGTLRADEYKRENIADDAMKGYADTRKLNSPSYLMNKIQNIRYKAEMNNKLFNGVRNGFSSAKGYVKGLTESLFSNVIPLALSAGTILTKGKISKVFAGALTAFGGVTVAKNAFGIGQNHYLK